MRFIGCKTNLLAEIDRLVEEYCGGFAKVFCDAFSGTGAVSRHFKQKYKIIANDLLYFSYILAAGTVGINERPKFQRLKDEGIADPLAFLESSKLPPNSGAGYVAQAFSPAGSAGRMYFTEENAARIDFIRDTIELWKEEELITQGEFAYLLASLIEGMPFVSNITGTYGAYLKEWDRRALKAFKMRRLEVRNNDQQNDCHNEDANNLIKKVSGDILYIDPPYNERQYLPNYHVLETVARNDKPAVYGVTGMRDYSGEKSRFCIKREAHGALADLICNADFRHIVMSYSDDGILAQEEIAQLLRETCVADSVKVYKIGYNRYKSKIQAEREEHFEYLFYAEKKR